MKTTLLSLFCVCLLQLSGISQTQVFHENFELPSLDDSVSYTNTPAWSINTTLFSAGTRSIYNSVQSLNLVSLITDSFSTVGKTNVALNFSHICKIEFYDTAKIEVSVDGGLTWILLTGTHYTGTGTFAAIGNRFCSASYAANWDPANGNTVPNNTWWKSESFNLSSIAANKTDVRIRFKLIDGTGGLPGANGNYGWILDDIIVNGAISELNPPSITLNNPILQDTIYGLGPYAVSATITDASGVLSAKLVYWVNNGVADTLAMTRVNSVFTGNIPPTPYNKKINYYIFATDSSASANIGSIPPKWFYIKKSPSIITLGTGTIVNSTTGYPTPYGNYYYGSKDQYLILASELTSLGMTAGPISSLAWDVSSVNLCPGLIGFNIMIGHTTQNALSSFITSNLNTVYTNASYQPVAGWNTHTFSTPFNWDGTSNIIIEVCFNNTSYIENAGVNQSTTSFVSTLNYHTDASGVCSSPGTPTTYSQRPNLKIGIISNSFPNDAGISQITEPATNLYTTATVPVKIQVKNYGVDTLKKVTINWSIDNVLQPSVIWTGALIQDVISTPFVVGNYAFSIGSHTIKIWTSMPNDSVDYFSLNDTLTKTIMVCSGPMTGNYTVGGTSSDFLTLNAAFSQLSSCGLSGHVYLNVQPGTYTEQLNLTSALQTDTNKTITIQSANGDSTSVIINFAATANTDNFVVKLDGAKYIIFNKLTLQANGATYGYVVQLLGGAKYNEFLNCVIKTTASTSSSFAGIYSPNSSGASFNLIKQNKIINGYYGIYFYGTSSLRKVGNRILDNQIENFYYYGIYNYYVDTVDILRNVITNANPQTTNYPMYLYYIGNEAKITLNKINITSQFTTYGIYVYNTGTNCLINKNSIILNTPTTNYGLYISSATGTSAKNVKVNNNMISLLGQSATTAYGIYNSSNTYIDYFYNTIHLQTGSTTGAYSFYSTSGSYTDVRNNSFTNAAGGYAIYISTITAITNSNFNNFYSTGVNLGYWAANCTNLAAWKTASSMDANSISVLPLFVGNADLHTFSIDLNGKATPISSISKDIDNDNRNTTTPDIGADEFNPPSVDAGIVAITAPVTPVVGGNNMVKVNLKNFGLDTLTQVTINWSINDTLKTPKSWTGILTSSLMLNVNIDSVMFISGNYKIKVWTSNPNNQADLINYNDTVVINVIACANPMSGVYTIGASNSNFPNINGAISAIKNCGINGPVVFLIKPGTYTEQIIVRSIPGASNTNTITFRPYSGGNNAVIIQYNSNTTYNYTLKLDSAKYIRFRSLTFKSLHATYGRVIEFAGGASYCIIDSCIIDAPVSTSSTVMGVYSTSSLDQFNQITNNQINNGYYGIYFYGTSSTSLEIGNTIKGNTISGFYYYGMYLYYQDYLKVTKNTIQNSTSSATAYGIYASYCDNGMDISQNKVILNPTTTGYGMYIYYCDGNSSSYGLISNNFISIAGPTSTIYGMYFSTSTYQNVVFNSINCTTGSTSRSIYTSGGSNLVFKNNCVVNRAASGYAFYIGTVNSVNANNNNYFVDGTNAYVGYYSANRATLTDFQTASGQDANSVSLNPGYYSITNLHVTSVGLNNKAVPFNGVLFDIDGQSRSSSTPDIGADEFTPQNKDVAPSAILQPLATYSPVGVVQTLEVELKNFGMDTIFSFPISFKFDLSTAVNEVWVGVLPPNGTVNHTFTQTFTAIAGTHTIKVYSALSGDQNISNDTLNFNFTGIPIVSLSYIDNFDGNTNYWATAGSQNVWQRGIPNKSIINNAYSAPNVWATNLTGQYPSNAVNEYLYTPYFSFQNVTGVMLKFRHWYDTQLNTDGCRIQYSDNGTTWTNLGYIGDPLATNWVNSNIGGIHTWTGSNSGWVLSTYDLTMFDNATAPIQFRFVFNSNASTNGDGWAIDNFELLLPPAPIDAAMEAIVEPVTSIILGSTVHVKVKVRNNGTNTLTSIPMHYRINNGAQVQGSWTGNLLPGDTLIYSFPTTFTSPSTTFSLCARVKYTGDAYSQNDSICIPVSVSPPPIDAGVYRILNPIDTITDLQVNHVVVVRFKNYGTTPITNMAIQYTAGTANPVVENWVGNLAPNDSADYTFTTSYKPNQAGWYQLCAKTILPGDGYAPNDQVCKMKMGGVGMDNTWGNLFSLEQNIPNPTIGMTTINLEIPIAGKLVFNLTDVLGKSIKSEEFSFAAGKNSIELNTTDFDEGVYFYSIEMNGNKLVRKMIVTH